MRRGGAEVGTLDLDVGGRHYFCTFGYMVDSPVGALGFRGAHRAPDRGPCGATGPGAHWLLPILAKA